MSIVKLQNISKQYRSVTALSGLDLEVQEGECLGLIGPNGAGKTTLLKLMVGLIRPGGGRVEVFGSSPWTTPETRKKMGYLPEQPALYPDRTCGEILTLSAGLHGLDWGEEQTRRALRQVGLEGGQDRRVNHLSKGMTQRLALACALVQDPALMLFDEPFSGLDPAGLQEWHRLLQDLKGSHTLVLSSHNLRRVEALCDRVALLRDGHLVALENMKELLSHTPLEARIRVNPPVNGLKQHLERTEGVRDVTADGPEFVVRLADPEVRPRLVRRLVEAGGELLEFRTTQPELEDLFARLTNGSSPAPSSAEDRES